MQAHRGYQDLNVLTWKGDTPAEMEFFLQQWDHIVGNITDTRMISEDVLRDLMYEKMKSSKVLNVELSHFKRARAKGVHPTVGGADDGRPIDPDFCLEYLRNCIETYIHDDREDKNLEGIRTAIMSTGVGGKNQQTLEGAPAAKSGKQPKSPKKNPKPKKAAPASGQDSAQQSSSSATQSKPKFCYFYNKGLRDGGQTTCTRRSCEFLHEKCSDEEWTKMKESPPMKRATSAASARGERRRSSTPARSRSASGGSKGSQGQRRGRSSTRKNDVKHCFKFLKEGKCEVEGCSFPHLSKEKLEEERKKRRKPSRQNSRGSNKSNKSNKTK